MTPAQYPPLVQLRRICTYATRFLVVIALCFVARLGFAQGFQQGFDFRNTSTFVTDPPGDTYVLSSTAYPTTVNGVTFGWASTSGVQARDRNAQLDPRLAGINFVNNGAPASFYVDLPSPGAYSLSLAMGDASYAQCYTRCQIQFFDGSTLLATVAGGQSQAGYFYDAQGNNWSAASWPSNNVSLPVTLSGTRLTVVVGLSQANGDVTPLAFLGVTQNSGGPSFTIVASPPSLSIAPGNQGTSTITTTGTNGFNSDITLSASGLPSGTTVSFNPNPIPAPGTGSSTMIFTVSSNTPTGTYPITVTGNGGGVQQSTNVTLTVGWNQGFDFRNTSTFVTDPPGDTFVLPSTTYPTMGNGVTYGWVNTSLVHGSDRNAQLDPRLAGINYASNGAPATFYVDLPSPGTYNLSMAMGDAAYTQCYTLCQVQFLDGNTVLATVAKGRTGAAYFYDAQGNNWSAAQWPTNNLMQQVTLAGSRLTVVVGLGQNNGDITPLAFLGVAQASASSGFTISASPSSLTVQQGNQGTSTITTAISGSFNSSIGLSASGLPYGASVTFVPNTILAPGAGSSKMTITVAGNTPVGTYPITVTGSGGGIQQSTTVTLTVTAQQQPNFTISASPSSLTVQQGNQGTSTITTTISGGFNSAISLSASGMPTGTTVSFNPNPIPAPGAGTSTMTITVGSSTPTGTYPITVTGSGGGIQQNTTVTLTVTAQQQPNFTISASPSSLTVQQGNQGTSTITTTISGGFNSAISLSASGMPSGTTVSFNPNPIPAPGAGSSMMTITVGGSTPTGTYPITVTGSGGGIQQNTTVTLTVTAQPNFTISASPSSLTVQQGNQGTSTITTTISGGFSSAISLSASGMPSGTTVSFNPNPIPAPGAGSSTMTITVGGSTPTGTYPITITGSGGGIQQNTTVTLTVTAQQQPNFTISASPSSLTVQQGNQGTSTITTTISGGFNSAISLSASGMPTGTTVSFNPNPIPAPGAGTSTMTITVGGSTPTGTYPITVTGNGGGIQQNTTLVLTVVSPSGWGIGFDFRATSNYVTDPPGDTYVLPVSSYPTSFNGITFGWTNSALVQARNRSTTIDPRLAGFNFAMNGSPATFYVDLPGSGTYNLTLAMGDAGYQQCDVQCQIQFLDGNTVLATLTEGLEAAGYFYDAKGNKWSAAQWPAQNVSRQVAISGSRLTVVVGLNTANGDPTPIAFLGLTQVSLSPNFLLSASPASLSVAQGNQGTSTITATIAGGFNSAIGLSASGMPSGTTVTFNPNPIPAPGAGSSTMTITVGANTPVGTYPITVTGSGGGIKQTTTVTLTVTAGVQPDYILTVSPPAVTVAQGAVGNTTATATLIGGFNSAISLSASGMPAGTTVSFNPNPIPAPGGGSSTMTITVAANTPLGTYPIIVTGNGGGIQHTFTVSLMVISSVWQQGFDFRSSVGFVNDPPGATDVIQSTVYPTTGTLTSYGWSYTANFTAVDRNSQIDPRLAGINFTTNGTPGAFYVDLPAPGTYSLSLAMGDAGYPQCDVQCQIQFLDGSSVLATVTGGYTNMGHFYDAQGNNWSAAQWPNNNVSRQVTLAGTQLTVIVGGSQYNGDITPIAYLGVTQVSAGPTFAVQAPPSITVGQGQYATGDVFTILIGGFNGAIALSGTGGPAGTTVTFNPATIPAPGAGTSIMTVSVPNNAPLGNYTLTVTGKGGGIVQSVPVVLTVTKAAPPSLTLTVPSAVSTAPGGHVQGSVFTSISDGFNSAVNLSASGAPSGTTVSFNPSTIPAPGAGSSVMTINVPAGAAFGSYPITVTAASGQGNQTAIVTLTISASGNANLPAGTGWVSLGDGANYCNVSPGYTYYNPVVGAVDAYDFLSNCENGQLVAWGGGAADTVNDRYFLWTSGHSNYIGNEMYVMNLQGSGGPSVARVTDPDWTVVNTDVPPDCICKGKKNCGQGLWHDGAGNPVSSPFLESASGGPLFESVPAPDGSSGSPSCGYGSRFTPNAREVYAGLVYNTASNKLFTYGGEAAADPTGAMLSNWSLDLTKNPAQWTRLKDFSYRLYTAAVYDYTSGHSTSGYSLVFDETQTLYAHNPATDTYTVLSNTLPYIGYNANIELDPLHHYLVMENGDSSGGYHLRIVNIDSCNGKKCTTTNLDATASCKGAIGYWVGLAWDSKRNVMAIFPSSTNCSGPACTPPFNTAYLLNTDPNNPVTIVYQGQQQTIGPQQCFAASYGSGPPLSIGPGVYSRFKYFPNEDVYLYVPYPSNPWILRLEH